MAISTMGSLLMPSQAWHSLLFTVTIRGKYCS
jgi:hypothetical protein